MIEGEEDPDYPAEWRRIVWGLFAAGFFAYFAYGCFRTGEHSYYARPGAFEPKQLYLVRGAGAQAQGVLYSCCAAWAHFHYFWAYFPKSYPLRWLVTRASVAVGIIALVVFFIELAQDPAQPIGY